jgi:glycine/sarcosine N-methyltransferase
MSAKVLNFYESLAEYYHLIFDDWTRAIEHQAEILNQILASQIRNHPLKILDGACGIGTQAIGLANLGHHIVASDLSPAVIARAKHEAGRRSLNILFHVSDMTSLAEIAENDFDVVATLDNALPHLSAHQLRNAVRAMASKLKPNGLFIASIRDYDKLVLQRPTMQEPAFYGRREDRRIVHQVWDWIGDTRYVVHLYITMLSDGEWKALHFISEYRSLLRKELSTVLESAGFEEIRWLMPAESGFYQPIVLARWQPVVSSY